MSRSTDGKLEVGKIEPGPVCGVCALFPTCNAICSVIEELIPSMERGRVDGEDLPRLHLGIRLTNAILDHEDVLTERQRNLVRLYYRENLLQHQIAAQLGITQQAVNDSLQRARIAVGRFLQGGAPQSMETGAPNDSAPNDSAPNDSAPNDSGPGGSDGNSDSGGSGTTSSSNGRSRTHGQVTTRRRRDRDS